MGCSPAGRETEMETAVRVRHAAEGDFERIAAIYAASVRTQAASFETEPPDADEMARRWRGFVAAGCPYLVADLDGAVSGYAYARPFHERAAFRWTVEDSIYLDAAAMGRGIGRHLLGALVEASAAAGFRQMIALISSGAAPASSALHAALGFRHAGRLERVGYKLGRWHDVVYMQRDLATGDPQAPPRPPAAVSG